MHNISPPPLPGTIVQARGHPARKWASVSSVRRAQDANFLRRSRIKRCGSNNEVEFCEETARDFFPTVRIFSGSANSEQRPPPRPKTLNLNHCMVGAPTGRCAWKCSIVWSGTSKELRLYRQIYTRNLHARSARDHTKNR